jgi:hypothetical protein
MQKAARGRQRRCPLTRYRVAVRDVMTAGRGRLEVEAFSGSITVTNR